MDNSRDVMDNINTSKIICENMIIICEHFNVRILLDVIICDDKNKP